MKRKNPRLCKVSVIIPSSDKKEIISAVVPPLETVSKCLDSVSDSIKDSFSITQKDILSSTLGITKILEKVIYISLVSLFVSLITLVLSFYV